MTVLLLLVDPRAGRRGLTDDEDERVLVLGAVPVHLLGEMGHKGAGPHRYRAVRIPLAAAADPPRALQHRDEAVVGMEMRLAEVIALEPLVHHDVEAGLIGITSQYDAGIAVARGLQLDLVRHLVDHRLRIELGRARGPRNHARGKCRADGDRGITSADERHGISPCPAPACLPGRGPSLAGRRRIVQPGCPPCHLEARALAIPAVHASSVMTGHSRRRTASFYSPMPGHPRRTTRKDVDARHEAGHDKGASIRDPKSWRPTISCSFPATASAPRSWPR